MSETKTAKEWAEPVIQFILSRGGVSMVEIEEQLKSAGMEVGGTLAAESATCPGVLFWVGMSSQFCDVFDALRRDDRVTCVPTNPLTYMIDGQMPNLPVATNPPRTGYKNDHWLPVAFNARKPGDCGPVGKRP